ncbi:hypothetical protein BDR22DRAFT_853500, partial [Usnea florida]
MILRPIHPADLEALLGMEGRADLGDLIAFYSFNICFIKHQPLRLKWYKGCAAAGRSWKNMYIMDQHTSKV